VAKRFDIGAFVDRVKEFDRLQIVAAAREEIARAEALSFRRKGAVRAREEGSTQYAEILKGLVWFLEQGTKPFGVPPADFRRFRPICEALIEKQQMDAAALKLFESATN